MTSITAAKVAILTMFNNYWTETSIPNLPGNVNIVSNRYDQTIKNPQVVVGKIQNTSEEEISNKDRLFKADVALHAYLWSDTDPANHKGMGTLLKQRDAMVANIRTIIFKHPDRPVSDIMHVFMKQDVADLDIVSSRPILLHTEQHAEVFYVESYL